MNSQLLESVSFIKSKITNTPKIALILGSGLGDFGNQLVNKTTIDAKEIPYYPISTVSGHAGKLHFGLLEKNKRQSTELLCFQGRVHFYECNNIHHVVYPINVAIALGVKTLIVTNAAGGINRNFSSGVLMFIRDYINLTGENPLIGNSDPTLIPSPLRGGLGRGGSYFDEQLLENAKSVALKNNISTKEGVYCWTKGPTYESAAEIRMMTTMGADAVGMSTVPEVIVAINNGVKVLGISCITNMATGISATKLSHEEVTETANRVKNDFTKLISEIIFEMG